MLKTFSGTVDKLTKDDLREFGLYLRGGVRCVKPWRGGCEALWAGAARGARAVMRWARTGASDARGSAAAVRMTTRITPGNYSIM